MPKFADTVSEAEVEKIKAYVLSRAWEAYDEQQKSNIDRQSDQAVPAARVSEKIKVVPPPREFAVCAACHQGGGTQNGVGPSLRGVVGRRSASMPGFSYSPAMAKAGLIWTEKDLEEFLTDPRKKVPGTSMAYVGVKDVEKRKAIIGYLKSLK